MISNKNNPLAEIRERCIKSFLDVIIGAILMSKSSWGYDIIADIHNKTNILLSPGAVYPVLYTMERNGLIKKEKEYRRRVYVLTNEGAKWLNQMLSASMLIPNVISIFTEEADFRRDHLS